MMKILSWVVPLIMTVQVSGMCTAHSSGAYCSTDGNLYAEGGCCEFQDSITGICPGPICTRIGCAAHQSNGYCAIDGNLYVFDECCDYQDSFNGQCPTDCTCRAHSFRGYCSSDGGIYPESDCCIFGDSFNGQCPRPCECSAHERTMYCSSNGNTYPIEECCSFNDAFDGTCPLASNCGLDCSQARCPSPESMGCTLLDAITPDGECCPQCPGCPTDQKTCPDGSKLSRSGTGCVFGTCPNCVCGTQCTTATGGSGTCRADLQTCLAGAAVCPTPAPVDCPGVCTTLFDPVCGSDGLTYGNPCRFSAAKRCDAGKASITSTAGSCGCTCGSTCQSLPSGGTGICALPPGNFGSCLCSKEVPVTFPRQLTVLEADELKVVMCDAVRPLHAPDPVQCTFTESPTAVSVLGLTNSNIIQQGEVAFLTFATSGLRGDASRPWIKVVGSGVLCTTLRGPGDAIAGLTGQLAFGSSVSAFVQLTASAGSGPAADKAICVGSTQNGQYRPLGQMIQINAPSVSLTLFTRLRNSPRLLKRLVMDSSNDLFIEASNIVENQILPFIKFVRAGTTCNALAGVGDSIIGTGVQLAVFRDPSQGNAVVSTVVRLDLVGRNFATGSRLGNKVCIGSTLAGDYQELPTPGTVGFMATVTAVTAPPAVNDAPFGDFVFDFSAGLPDQLAVSGADIPPALVANSPIFKFSGPFVTRPAVDICTSGSADAQFSTQLLGTASGAAGSLLVERSATKLSTNLAAGVYLLCVNVLGDGIAFQPLGNSPYVRIPV